MPDWGIEQPLARQGGEQRSEARYALLLRPAKIVAPFGEYLCILRDVSARGLKLRLFHPLPPGQRMLLELANGDRYEVERVWERDDQAGFEFVHAADLRHLLSENSRFPKRQLRLNLQTPAMICVNGVACPVVLHNLSQMGGRLEYDGRLAIDQQRYAKVRWRRPPAHGFVFEETFRLDELARLAAALQPFPAAAPEEDEVDALFARLRQQG